MLSREVKASEQEKGLKAQILAFDGLAIIVNKDNALENLTKTAS